MCDKFNDSEFDDELYNECEEIETRLSQSQPDKIKGEAGSSEEDMPIPLSVVCEDEDALGVPLPAAERSIPSPPRSTRSNRRRKLTTFQRILRQELRWYRREEIREKNYHKRELDRIRLALKRIEMEKIKCKNLNDLLSILAYTIPSLALSKRKSFLI